MGSVFRAWPLACFALTLVPNQLLAEGASLGSASAFASSPGDTVWALPGIVRVGVPGLGPRRLAAAGSAGYGLTEAQSTGDSAHHRLFGTVAVGVAPLPALELSLRLDGRYDRHPDDGAGAHGGAVGDPRLLARYGVKAGPAFRVGAELGAWFPGKDAPSVSFDATTVDARLLAAFTPATGPLVAASLGFRFDQSAKASPTRNLIRPGDRLALGLSEFNAVLCGVGIAVPRGRFEILGELSADILVGSGGPGIGRSPLRVTAGVRHHLSPAFAIEGLAEVTPSGRPPLGPNDPLVPVEPRFSLMLGLRYRLPFDSTPARAALAATPEPARPAVDPRNTAAITVRVVGEAGTEAKHATVTITSGEAQLTATSIADGTYRADAVPLGAAKIGVVAEGFEPVEQSLDVGPNSGTAPIEIRMKALPPSGQLRGLVRSFAGRGLKATIHVDPVGLDVKTDANGAFTLDVPPGEYQVSIRATRFKEQRRKVHVDQNGVTVINAELFEGK